MLAVNGMASFLSEENVSGHDQILGEGWPSGKSETGAPFPLVHHAVNAECRLLTMIHHRQSELARVLNGATHHPMILNAAPVIRQSHDSGCCQCADGSHLLAGNATRDGARAEDIHTRSRRRALLNPGDHGRTVGHWVCVRHTDN